LRRCRCNPRLLRCAPPPRFACRSIHAAAIALPLLRCALPPLFAPPPPPLRRQALAPLPFSCSPLRRRRRAASAANILLL
jgi:hypothetical protein